MTPKQITKRSTLLATLNEENFPCGMAKDLRDELHEMIDKALKFHDKERIKKLIKELEDYIEFLGKHLGNHEVFMSNRNYNPDKKAIQEGKDRRKRIKDLKS